MATRGGNGSERSGSIIRVVLLIAWARGVKGQEQEQSTPCSAGYYDACTYTCSYWGGSYYDCRLCSAVRWRRRLYAPAQQPVQPPNLSPPLLRANAQGKYSYSGASSCTSCAAVRLHALRVVALLLPAQQPVRPPSLLTILPRTSAPLRRARTTQALAERPPPHACLARRYVCMPCAWSLFVSRAAANPALFPLNHSPPHLRIFEQGKYNPSTGSTSSAACQSCAAVRLHALRMVALSLPAQQPAPPPFPLTNLPRTSAPLRRASTARVARHPAPAATAPPRPPPLLRRAALRSHQFYQFSRP
jgi:hypothetical protein